MKLTNKNNKLSVKAAVAVIILAAGTLHTFVELAQANDYLVVASGVALTFFCVEAIITAFKK